MWRACRRWRKFVNDQRVIFEMISQGAYLKVVAVDPKTSEEAMAFGPANDPLAVKALALQRLQQKLTPPSKPSTGVRA